MENNMIYLVLRSTSQDEFTEPRWFCSAMDATDVVGAFDDKADAERLAEYLNSRAVDDVYDDEDEERKVPSFSVLSIRKNEMIRVVDGARCMLAHDVDAGTPISIFDNALRVDLVDIGEGYNGDYNHNDPEDEPLLRFDVQRWDDAGRCWAPIEGASRCTCIPVCSSKEDLERYIVSIFAAIRKTDFQNESNRRLYDELSWTGTN